MNKLSLSCAINTVGYGISGYNLWKALRKNNNISLFPVGQVEAEKHWNTENIISDIKNQQQIYSPSNPCLKIWHPHDLVIKPHTKNSIYATYSFFEIDSISDVEKIGYDISDIIFTPSSWAKNILINNVIEEKKITVCPCGVDTNVFDKNISIDEADVSPNYVFFNAGKWEIRKGHDILVHIFNEAFEPKDNVELWMANTNPFLTDKENGQWQNMYKNTKLGDKIHMIPRLPSQKQLARIMAYTDCGIYPARAEGWNNEALETMAMNKPIILTNYSAHTEYANSNNSYLINITDMEIAEDGKFFHSTGNWANLDKKVIDQGVDYMRYVYKNNIKSNSNGLKTADKFSWEQSAKIIGSKIYG